MNTPIKEYIRAGLIVKIYQDENMDSPQDWGDDALFLVANHRNFCVREKDITDEVISEIFMPEEDAETNLYAERAKELKKQYHVFGLEAYIHSGVVLALSREGNFVDRQWDVSQLGAVFVKKTEARTRASAKKMAQGLIETWNQYLSGDVYGFMIEDAEGNHLESCWGFYGMDAVEEGANESAEGEAKRIMLKHIVKKKAEIKNNVPLARRTTLEKVFTN